MRWQNQIWQGSNSYSFNELDIAWTFETFSHLPTLDQCTAAREALELVIDWKNCAIEALEVWLAQN